ncbi:MAG: hypothetical protein K0R78_419 [Pelosinus sp.]|jgi:uncharacterized membrane-anchored protein YjiN (DUF445 family)|nr:hypothetical protein [Pelosinus sp.]
MIANKYKATCILGIVSCGFLASYPFAHTFLGGLLNRGFGAAMIGGLADWFAVSALFRRPLGIPFSTAIIPRNREKIFQALVYMVEHEILIKDNIKKRLDDYDLSATLLYFMNDNSGKQDVKKMIYRFLQDFLLHIKPEELEAVIEKFVEENIENSKMLPYVIPSVQWLIDHEYDDKVLDLLISQCILVVEKDKFPHLLADVFAAVIKKYEHGMDRRKLFNLLMDLSPKQLAKAAQHGLLTILSEMQSRNHPLRLEGKAKLEQFVAKMKIDEDFQYKVETWMQQNIIRKFNLGEKMGRSMVTVYHKVVVDNKIIVRGMEALITHLDVLIANLAKNQEDRRKVDIYLKATLSEWIDTHHDEIGRIVKESLNEFTNERLVNFVENKMGNDLQMIRINGSIVGGLVGVIIYGLTFWL